MQISQSSAGSSEAAKARTAALAEPLVWLVISLPLAAIVASASIMHFALQRQDSNSGDDASRYSPGINAELTRQAQARTLGLAVQKAVLSGHETRVELRSIGVGDLPATLTLRLTHPVAQRFDKTILLNRIATGAYVGPGIPAAVPGTVWQGVIDTPTWRVVFHAR